MKKEFFLVIAAMLFNLGNAHAFVAICTHGATVGDDWKNPSLNHYGLHSDLKLDCYTRDRKLDQKYGGVQVWHHTSVDLKTEGPGLQALGDEMLTITCPLVSQKRLDRVVRENGSWSADGVDASASFVFGARAGIAFNQKFAACAVAGLSAFTGGVSVGTMEIKVNDALFDTIVEDPI